MSIWKYIYSCIEDDYVSTLWENQANVQYQKIRNNIESTLIKLNALYIYIYIYIYIYSESVCIYHVSILPETSKM